MTEAHLSIGLQFGGLGVELLVAPADIRGLDVLVVARESRGKAVCHHRDDAIHIATEVISFKVKPSV